MDPASLTRLYALTACVLLILLAGVAFGLLVGWRLCERVWAARVRGMIEQGNAVIDGVGRTGP